MSKEIIDKLKKLKKESGSHSPSIINLKSQIKGLEIKIDACFLSNPYATDLFYKMLKDSLIKTNKLRDVIEFYPSQNNVISSLIENYLDLNSFKVIVGNGAEEIIEKISQFEISKGILITIPTYSSYYEFVPKTKNILHYELEEKNDFNLDIDHYINFVKNNKDKIDSILIINPNNPNGSILSKNKLKKIFSELSFLKTIILDESFSHFKIDSINDDNFNPDTYMIDLIEEFKNIVVIKSMSKDFGIAGIRSGYAIVNKNLRYKLMKTGFLWNSNGLSEFFFREYIKSDFQKKYKNVRKKYIKNNIEFYKELKKINGIKIYPSQANFYLVNTCNINNFDVFTQLLVKYGIYTRVCDDKIGLEKGKYIRLASRSIEENKKIILALKEIYEKQ